MHARIGTIIDRTLLTRELALAFVEELRALAGRDNDPRRRSRIRETLKQADLDIREDDEDAMMEFVNETAPALFDEYAPPYCYFGSHPGDGSDFGIWPSVESLMEDARAKNGVVSVPAGDPWPQLGSDIVYVAEVNEHGNLTLFERRGRKELWSVV